MKSSNVIIRRATASDAVPYRALRLEALEAHPEAFSADLDREMQQPVTFWQERLSSSNGAVFIAVQNGDMIGMAGIYRSESKKLHHNATIWGVYVRADHRGARIGEQLLDACFDWARSHDLKLVKLAVTSTNTPAIRCYERAGFRSYGLDPAAVRHDGVDYDEILMARDVALKSGPA